MTKIGFFVVFSFTAPGGSGELRKSRFALYFFSEFLVAIAASQSQGESHFVSLRVFGCFASKPFEKYFSRKGRRDSPRRKPSTCAKSAQGSSKLFDLADQLFVATARILDHVTRRALDE